MRTSWSNLIGKKSIFLKEEDICCRIKLMILKERKEMFIEQSREE